MNGMDTSSGLKLSLRWRSKTAEKEDQLDTRELVELLKKDYRLMSEEEAARLQKEQEEQKAQAAGNGQAIVDYACQFIGNPYVWGGTSLTNGADCSGFVTVGICTFWNQSSTDNV